ncbi:MAG: hypothetical protein RL113_1358 [Pseudomonadota bacterium]|jgi:uroporphyrinogen-III synthase
MSSVPSKIYLLSSSFKEGVVHLPMIEFSLVKTMIDFSQCDLLMFTSKQAVKSAELLDPDWKKKPCLAIGDATAKEIVTLGGEVVYQSEESYGKALSNAIKQKFSDQKILYLRPKEVSFDAKDFLAQRGITLEEAVIYETSCIRYAKEKQPPPKSFIIFTSPSTVHCFLKNFEWDESYTAVVIGDVTGKHLPEHISYKVADKQTIDACIEKAGEILLDSNPE